MWVMLCKLSGVRVRRVPSRSSTVANVWLMPKDDLMSFPDEEKGAFGLLQQVKDMDMDKDKKQLLKQLTTPPEGVGETVENQINT